MLSSFWIVVLTGAVVVAFVAATWLLLRRRRLDSGRTKTVALVRRRRELIERLHELAGESGGSELARLEARRLRDASSSIPVLEAAIARAERQLARERETAAQTLR